MVRFELVRPNPAGGGNNFVIQLDGNAPVNTSEPEYTFTGMRSGQHILTVREVDANGTPMPDAGAEVQFSVKPPEGTVPSQSDVTAVPNHRSVPVQ
jgi:predicted phage tail protein